LHPVAYAAQRRVEPGGPDFAKLAASLHLELPMSRLTPKLPPALAPLLDDFLRDGFE
jgi:hypothetical protein